MPAPAISSSLEDYVEAIYLIAKDGKAARVSAIARMLHVTRASVTGALRALAERGLVDYAPYHYPRLTDKGMELGKRMFRRHSTITDFFINVLGVEAVKAEEAACRMEHAFDKDMIDRMVRLGDFLNACPRAGLEWIQDHIQASAPLPRPPACKTCIENCSAAITSTGK